MRLLALLLAVPLNAFAVSQEAKEFMDITAQLEPVQCKKRQLRREIVLADTEGRAADARRLRDDFAQINRQHVEAFYRCD